MQSFTKTEISWIIVEFEKLAKNYEMQVDDAPTHAEANMLRLRAAAMNACKANNIPIPVIRTIEPPEKVYKKCIGGIIVVASIPKDAQVTLDPCATPETAKCAKFYTEKDDGLAQDWTGETVFCNPPYSDQQQTEWVKKCYDHAIRGG